MSFAFVIINITPIIDNIIPKTVKYVSLNISHEKMINNGVIDAIIEEL